MKLITTPSLCVGIILCLVLSTAQNVYGQIYPPELSEFEESSDLNYHNFLDPGEVPSGLNSYNIGGTIEILGDINGDGYDDWGVVNNWAIEYESNDRSRGAVHIYFGGPEKRQSETKADLMIYSKDLDDEIAPMVNRAGDVNADGFDDILIRSYTGWHLLYGGNPFNTEPDLYFEKLSGHEGSASFAHYAGDVNSDGYDDITMSVTTYVTSLDTMHAYLYLGGAPMDTIPDKIFAGGWFNNGVQFGATMLKWPQAAGDMNNDGYDDIMISSSYGTEIHFGAENMDTETDVLLTDLRGGGIGTGPGLTAAGDVNNDGYDDILLLAQIGTSKALLYLGGETVDIVPDLEIPGLDTESKYPISATSLGDLNKDGFDDIMLGIFTGWRVDTNRVGIFFGGDPMDSIADVTIMGPELNQTFGYAVKGNADFNGDGNNDFLIGNNGATYTIYKFDDAGDISLFYGGDEIDTNPSAVFSGVNDGEAFGFSSAFAGDVNNDGYVDILVGAPNYPRVGTQIYRGRAYLYYGGENADNVPDKIFTSTDSIQNMLFGKNVLAAGDLNGDGYDDIAIEENGLLHMYLGGENMDTLSDYSLTNYNYNVRFTPVGDVNDDGAADYLWRRSDLGVGGTAGLRLGGENVFVPQLDLLFEGGSGEMMGGQCTKAGDLNGDGINDFVISAHGVSTDGMNEGAAYVFFGKEEPTNIPDITIRGTSQDQYLGSNPIVGGRDLNGDSYDDLVIGHRFFDLTPDGDEGRLYIYLGGTSMDGSADITITGVDPGDQLGRNIQLLPDINGDGYDEVLTNKGNLYSGDNTESSIVFLGGDPPDTIADISSDFVFNQQDFDGYVDESGPFTLLIVGDYSNYAAGPSAGRVHVLSTETIVIILSLEISKNSLSFGYAAAETDTFSIQSNTSWSISSDVDWLTITPESGENNATVRITTDSENPSASETRSATVTITGEEVELRTLTVTQEAAPVSAEHHRSSILNLYPNPFSSIARLDYLQAEAGEMEWLILNSMGQEVYHSLKETRKMGHQSLVIQPEGLEPGVYYLQLRTPSTIHSLKMVIKR